MNKFKTRLIHHNKKNKYLNNKILIFLKQLKIIKQKIKKIMMKKLNKYKKKIKE